MEVDDDLIGEYAHIFFRQASYAVELPDDIPEWLSLPRSGTIEDTGLGRLEILPDEDQAQAGTYDIPLTLRFSSSLFTWDEDEGSWTLDLRLIVEDGPRDDPDGRPDAGGAYLLDAAGNEVAFLPGEQAGARLGARVSTGPDLDGDGLPALALLDANGLGRLLELGVPDAGRANEEVLGGATDKRCFIATAAWGSSQSPYVNLLRQFRDRYLLTYAPGRILVAAYYRLSPPFAAWLAEHDTARTVVRLGLWPLVGLAWLAVYYPQGLLALIFLTLGGWWAYRRHGHV